MTDISITWKPEGHYTYTVQVANYSKNEGNIYADIQWNTVNDGWGPSKYSQNKTFKVATFDGSAFAWDYTTLNEITGNNATAAAKVKAFVENVEKAAALLARFKELGGDYRQRFFGDQKINAIKEIQAELTELLHETQQIERKRRKELQNQNHYRYYGYR
jgi:hypothetical protein